MARQETNENMIRYESESHLREEEERELQGAIIESHKQFGAGMLQLHSNNHINQQ